MAPFVNGRVKTNTDLYCCPGAILGPSIVARFGDEGSHYSSMPAKYIERDMERWASQSPMSTYCEALIQGYLRAEKRELLGS